MDFLLTEHCGASYRRKYQLDCEPATDDARRRGSPPPSIFSLVEDHSHRRSSPPYSASPTEMNPISLLTQQCFNQYFTIDQSQRVSSNSNY